MNNMKLLKTYIDKTYGLNQEWSDLIEEMKVTDVLSERFQEIDNRLKGVQATLASNAIIISNLVVEMGVLSKK